MIKVSKSFKIGCTTVVTYLHNHIQYFISFLFPVFVLFLSYLISGMHPGGDRSILTLDLNAQYISLYQYLYDVLAGKESIFYCWSRNLSGEFLGVVAYYLSSPFIFLIYLWPREMIIDGVMTMILAKVGTIGLVMSVYLSKSHKCNRWSSIIFSACYSLSSYVIVNQFNPMWIDGLIALPFICLGIEKLIDYGEFKMLFLSWLYAFVSCFYIGYMLAIFSVIYAIYYCFVSDSITNFKYVLLRARWFTAAALAAGLSSTFILLPAYSSLSNGKLDYARPDFSFEANFSIFEFFEKLLPNSYDTVKHGGLPFIYCGVITLIPAVCYFFIKNISRRKRLAGAGILLVMFICMLIRPINLLWHGGKHLFGTIIVIPLFLYFYSPLLLLNLL